MPGMLEDFHNEKCLDPLSDALQGANKTFTNLLGSITYLVSPKLASKLYAIKASFRNNLFNLVCSNTQE